MATLINFNQLGFQAGNYPIFRQNHNHRPSFWPFIHLAASLWRPLMSTFVPLGISPSGISWLNQLEHDPKRMPRSRACVQDPAPPPSLSLFFWGFVQLTCYNICSPNQNQNFGQRSMRLLLFDLLLSHGRVHEILLLQLHHLITSWCGIQAATLQGKVDTP